MINISPNSSDTNKSYIIDIVQAEIVRKYYDEQPIGTCLLLKTNNDKFPHLAHATTIRIPRTVKDSENAYTAFSACTYNHNPDRGGSQFNHC